MSQTLYAHRVTEPLSPDTAENDYEMNLAQRLVTATDPAHPGGFLGNNEVHTALSTITTGISTGQSPLQFKSAINTAHAHMGNRAFMHYVGQQYQQQVHDIAQDGISGHPPGFPLPGTDTTGLWRIP